MKFLVFSFLLCGIVCCGGDETPKSHIQFIESHKLEIPEPSGITFDHSDSTLWIVSDENSTVYKTDLQGNIISSFKVDGEDLEGITTLQQSYLAVILERVREILYLKRDGTLYARRKTYLTGLLNNGLEGIGYSNKEHLFYVVNEKNPRILIGYSDSVNEQFRDTLKFASDFSGVYYDDEEEMLWIVSDEASTLFLLNKEREVIGAYPLGIKQLEGVAYDRNTKRLYLVSDLNEKLYVYELINKPSMEKKHTEAGESEGGEEGEEKSEH